MKPVQIYTTETCAFCSRAKDFLQKRGVPYEEIDASDDDVREKLVLMSGGRRTVPQIFIGGQAVGGYSDLVALQAQGQLEALLAD